MVLWWTHSESQIQYIWRNCSDLEVKQVEFSASRLTGKNLEQPKLMLNTSTEIQKSVPGH